MSLIVPDREQEMSSASDGHSEVQESRAYSLEAENKELKEQIKALEGMLREQQEQGQHVIDGCNNTSSPLPWATTLQRASRSMGSTVTNSRSGRRGAVDPARGYEELPKGAV